jgi:hypothetical protein
MEIDVIRFTRRALFLTPLLGLVEANVILAQPKPPLRASVAIQSSETGLYENINKRDIRLGQAFDPANPTAHTYANSRTGLAKGAERDDVRIEGLTYLAGTTEVGRIHEKWEAFRTSLSYDAKILRVHARYGQSVHIRQVDKEVSLYFVLEVATTADSVKVADVTVAESLRKDAESADTHAKRVALSEKYGPKVVTGVIRGAQVVAHYHLKISSSERLKEVVANLDAKLRWKGDWGASFTFLREVKEIDTQLEWSLKFHQFGGINLDVLDDLPQTDKESPGKLRAVMAKALDHKASPADLPVLRFETCDLASLPALEGSALAKHYWENKGMGNDDEGHVFLRCLEETELAKQAADGWLLDARRAAKEAKYAGIRMKWAAFEIEVETYLKVLEQHRARLHRLRRDGTLTANPPAVPALPAHPPLVEVMGWRHYAYGREQGGGVTPGLIGPNNSQHEVITSYPLVELPVPRRVKSIQLRRQKSPYGRLEDITVVIEGKGLAAVAEWGGTVPTGKPLSADYPDCRLVNPAEDPNTGARMATGGDPFDKAPSEGNHLRHNFGHWVDLATTRERIEAHRDHLSKWEYSWSVTYADGTRETISLKDKGPATAKP